MTDEDGRTEWRILGSWIVTRKGEHSQLELRMLVLSSGRHGTLWMSAQMLCLEFGSETD